MQTTVCLVLVSGVLLLSAGSCSGSIEGRGGGGGGPDPRPSVSSISAVKDVVGAGWRRERHAAPVDFGGNDTVCEFSRFFAVLIKHGYFLFVIVVTISSLGFAKQRASNTRCQD